jgi:hypothetical protein
MWSRPDVIGLFSGKEVEGIAIFLPEIGDDEAVWDGGRFISFLSLLIIVWIVFFMVVLIQNSNCFWPVLSLILVTASGEGVQPIDPPRR